MNNCTEIDHRKHFISKLSIFQFLIKILDLRIVQLALIPIETMNEFSIFYHADLDDVSTIELIPKFNVNKL